MLVFQVLGEVHLGLRLMDGDLVLVRDGNHVHVLPLDLLLAHGPLPDADSDLVVGHRVAVFQRVELQGLLGGGGLGQE